jgi:hypothetical protein
MLTEFFQWLQDSQIGTTIREDGSYFPWIESVHVLALTMVVGTIAIIDLRLLDLASRHRSVHRMVIEILPYSWTAFALALVTGGTLFASNAVKYSENWPFRAKMVLLLLAGLNMLLFHFVTGRGLKNWDPAIRSPIGAKLAGGISLGLWVGVVACGRWIGFTMNPF